MTPSSTDAQDSTPAVPRPPRVWPAALIVGAFWTAYWVPVWFELPIYQGFFTRLGASLLLLLAFPIWWLTNRTVTLRDRLFAFCANVAGALVAGFLSDKSVGPMGQILFGVPAVFTLWTLWLLLARTASPVVRGWGLAAVIWLTWASFTTVRVGGIDGNQRADLHWRWAATPEELFLAERTQREPPQAQVADARDPSAAAADTSAAAAVVSAAPLELQAGDWPGFRGPARDGAVHGVRLATDWSSTPPTPVWRKRVGPAWSSFVAVGDRLFTQEQRGEQEAVVCLDAASGRELWAHQDLARFWDGQGGAGPRATPALDAGALYSCGASGIVNALDAATGRLLWTRNITQDCDAQLPMWGFSGSPLVTGGLVVVFAGGPVDQALLAYRAEDGQLAWKAHTGSQSYSSPQLETIDGQPQILLLSDKGLTAVAADSGQVLWIYPAEKPIWRAVQPRSLGANRVLLGAEDLGLILLDVKRTEGAWQADELWTSQSLRPAYNDFVVYDGHAYGFDGGIFACVDLHTGRRSWKAGRYGHGQVLLLADQPLLLVLCESGELVLLSPNPARHDELARMQALDGKTWNHPVLAHGRLFVRNDAEMACFAVRELSGE